MVRIMVMKGLLIGLMFMWSSAAREPSARLLIKSSEEFPTGPLSNSQSEPQASLNENPMEIRRRKNSCSLEHDGKCVRRNRRCPSSLETSPGKPYCSKRRRCCYLDETSCTFNSTEERDEFSKLWPGRCPKAGPDCDLNWQEVFPGSRPLILLVDETSKPTTYDIVLPIKPKAGDSVTTTIKNGKKLIFSCPGKSNAFKNTVIPANTRMLEAKCSISEIEITAIAKKLQMTDMGCLSKPSAIINPAKGLSKVACGGKIKIGNLYNIAFATSFATYRYYNQIEVCFVQPLSQTTLWTRHTLYGKSSLVVPENYNRPNTFGGREMFSFNNAQMKDIYRSSNEKQLLKKVLANEDEANMIINEKEERFFNKGHLSPSGDFPTKAGRDATFLFVNALPAWAKYNGGNWNTVELQIRNLAVKNSYDLDIYTGGAEILNLKFKEIFLGETYSKKIVPVPNLMWKIVILHGSPKDKAVAFVTYNFQFSTPPVVAIIPKNPCPVDVCRSLTWLPSDITDELYEYEKGKTFCCEVGGLDATVFPNIPDIGIVDLLA